MARPKGTKNIETPERMWELFCNYRDELRANPILIVEQRKGTVVLGKKGESVDPIIELPTRRPLTMEGFQNYLDDQEIISDVTDYFENKGERYVDYVRICQRIKRTIRQDQIEGGMAGIYNPSITQRLNNLVEKTENRNIEQPLFPDVPKDDGNQ